MWMYALLFIAGAAMAFCLGQVDPVLGGFLTVVGVWLSGKISFLNELEEEHKGKYLTEKGDKR